MSLLELNDVSVRLHGAESNADLVSGISLAMEPGDALCLVGESGSGKTVTALSIMRLLEYTSPVQVHGDIRFRGQLMTDLAQREMAGIRGSGMAMIFQECMEALNPTQRIGAQLIEPWRYHERDSRLTGATHGACDRSAARARALDLLRAVEIPDPEGCLERYPHQLSGGMQQRVMIAMALMCDPDLLIADEPTTALDVTIQAEILRLLAELRTRRRMALLLITHDIAVAAQISDRIGVMYSGRLVELATTRTIGNGPLHPYTRGLLACVPDTDRRTGRRLATIPGSVPDATQSLPGCRFAPRCPLATERCHTDIPPLTAHSEGHLVACWHAGADTGEWRSMRARSSRPSAVTPRHAPTPPESGPGSLTPDPATARADPTAAQPGQGPGRPAPVASATAVSKFYAGSARRGGLRRARRADSGTVIAVDGVSLRIEAEEIVGLVGETGSGKSTLGRLITALDEPSEGTVSVDGLAGNSLRGRGAVKDFRRRVQMVFQDPHGSLDPRLTAQQSVAEPLTALLGLSASDAARRAAELLERVGLPPATVTRRPHEMSGGQRQRVAVARAIAVHPKLVVADEPTSALDVSVQGQVMNLLLDLRRDLGLAYLLISHNLSLVLAVADRVGVMYRGALVELAPAEALLHRPAHPYSAQLLAANPELAANSDLAAEQPGRTPGPGGARLGDPTGLNPRDVPEPGDPRPRGALAPEAAGRDVSGSPAAPATATGRAPAGTGCRYRARCPRRQPRCDREEPALRELADGHFGACHFPATERLTLLGAPR